MKNKTKNKKNKIPLCPQKTKPIKKKIIINKLTPKIRHWKQPSTPCLSFTKNINLSLQNNNETINSNTNENTITHNVKDKENNDRINKNPFQAFIPRSKSFTDSKLKNQNIVLVKKVNKPNNIPFNFTNLKEYNYKKDIKNNVRSNDEFKKIIKEKDKDTLSSINSHYMNNANTNANSNTTIGMSQIFSDRCPNEEPNKLFTESKNPFEFTFGDINFFQNQLHCETKTSLVKKNLLNMTSGSKFSVENNYQSIDKNNTNSNYNNINKKNKNIFVKNIINNIKLINPNFFINNKNIKQKNIENTNIVKSYSLEKDPKIKDKNKINKISTFYKWPKFKRCNNNNIEKNNKNNKNSNKNNIIELNKSPKFSKKLSNLIPVDKNHNLNKKNILIIKNQLNNNTIGFYLILEAFLQCN